MTVLIIINKATFVSSNLSKCQVDQMLAMKRIEPRAVRLEAGTQPLSKGRNYWGADNFDDSCPIRIPIHPISRAQRRGPSDPDTFLFG